MTNGLCTKLKETINYYMWFTCHIKCSKYALNTMRQLYLKLNRNKTNQIPLRT